MLDMAYPYARPDYGWFSGLNDAVSSLARRREFRQPVLYTLYRRWLDPSIVASTFACSHLRTEIAYILVRAQVSRSARATDIIAEAPGSQWRRRIDERDTSENMTTGLLTKSNPFFWWIWYPTFVDDAMTFYRTLQVRERLYSFITPLM